MSADASTGGGRLAVAMKRWGPWLLGLQLLVTVVSFVGGSWWWPLELASHFRFQWAWACGVVAIALGAARCWRLALGVGLLAALNAGPVVATYTGRIEPTKGASTVRLLFLNLNSGNTDHQAVIDHVTHESADFVVLAELNEDWMEAVTSLEGAGYVHRLAEPHFDNFGIALLSRHPLRGGIMQLGGDAAPPSIVASSPAHQLILIGAHVWPPISAEHAALRDRQLTAIAAHAAEVGGRVLLVGDFNATPWSPVFSTVLERGGLRDSRRGFGLHTTWPAMLPAPLRIPIDHVLTSRSVVVTERRVGPYVGSDHLSVTVDVALE